MEKTGSVNQSVKPQRIPVWMPALLWLFCFPLGIAMQNLVSGLAFLLCLYLLARSRKFQGITWLRKEASLPLLCMIGCFSWITLATLLNPQNPAGAYWLKFPPGYLTLCFFPPLFVLVYGGKLSGAWWNVFLKFVAIAVFIWGLIALSQSLTGWRVLGSGFILEEARRPRGLYSHPLTFAYAAFMFWPLCTTLLLYQPENRWAWLMTFGTGTILLLTQSRTVQAVALAVVVVNVFLHLKGRWRPAFIAGSLFLGGLALVIPNPVSEKFIKTFNSEGVDVHSNYPDDRLAFWHAHWLMVRERPLTGHGFQINTEYRTPYYQKIGLSDFLKKYEAHNMYLQLWCNGGLIALLLFFLWSFWMLREIIRCHSSPFFRQVALSTFCGFLLTGLTQNALQDASVRMVLSMFVTVCWLVFYQESLKDKV